MKGAGELIKEAVLAWAGVEASRTGSVASSTASDVRRWDMSTAIVWPIFPCLGSSMTRSSRRVAPSFTTCCLNRVGSVAGWPARTTPPA